MSWLISLKKPCDGCDPNVPKLYGGIPACKKCFDKGYILKDFTLEEFLNFLNGLNLTNGNQ